MAFFLLVIVHVLFIDYCSTLSGFNLYHTYHRQNTLDHDCLYYFTPEIDSIHAYQFIEYCIRSPLDEEVFDDMDNDNRYTFEDLRQKNITSDHLYYWSVPIDLIEDYQNYLETNISTNNFVFYNCTYPWFGSRCEYRFDKSQSHFGEQARLLFTRKADYDSRDLIILPCYTHLQCDRVGDHGRTPGACLDWREVCDGKVDCIDGGQDEEPCWQLELNECDEKTEFRCHNGLCIPLAFLRDDEINADCLDRSDEPLFIVGASWYHIYYSTFPTGCSRDPAFRCEEQRCHPSTYRNHMFECGDGSCMEIQNACMNKRNSKLLDALWLGTNLSDDCRLSIVCFTKLNMLEFLGERCTSSVSTYVKNIARYCPPLIALPPILFDHVRFVYTNNQSQVSK
jgi:hypothetical protein